MNPVALAEHAHHAAGRLRYLPIDRDELASEALVLAVETDRAYNPALGVPWDAWMRYKLRRRLLDWARVQLGRSERSRYVREVAWPDGYDTPGYEDVERTVLARLELDALLGRLSPVEREVLCAPLLGGVAVAGRVGVSKSAVSHRRKRMLERLR